MSTSDHDREKRNLGASKTEKRVARQAGGQEGRKEGKEKKECPRSAPG